MVLRFRCLCWHVSLWWTAGTLTIRRTQKGAGSGLSKRTLFFLGLFLGLLREGEASLVAQIVKKSESSEGNGKAGIKLNIKKTKIMASSPITSWQIDGETMEIGTDFIFLDSKITADGDCGHEIKRHLLLGRKTRTNIDSVLKSRDITLPTKVLSKQWLFQQSCLDMRVGS